MNVIGWMTTNRQGEGAKCTQGTMMRSAQMEWGLPQSVFPAMGIGLVSSPVGHCWSTESAQVGYLLLGECEGQLSQMKMDTLGVG